MKAKLVKFNDDGTKCNYDIEYLDFTIGATEEQRKSYLARHASGKTAKPDTPNALSYYILWGKSRSRSENINTFKKKYNI